MKADEMRALLRKACERAGSQSAFARKVGVSVAHVNAVLHGKPPGPVILEALGLEAITEYRKIRRPLL
jgi:DNA-binding transcriptional regulator YdaS (Cro superfamily)